MHKNRSFIKRKISSYPLWLQAALLFSILVTLAIVILIMNNYQYNKNKVLESYVKNNETVLSLEMDSLSRYIRDLTSFAIQPCFDMRFSRIIEGTADVSDDDIDYVRDQMRALYYTRNDLNSYELYLMNHDIKVGRQRGASHVSAEHYDMLTEKEKMIFEKCANSKYFLYVDASDDRSDLLTFYHSIIRIKDKQSLAYVKCDIDMDFINSMLKNYDLSEGEVLFLYNGDGKMLYSSDLSIAEMLPKDFINNYDVSYVSILQNGKKYLVTLCPGSQYGITLISLKPYDILAADVVALLHALIAQGIIVWLIFVIIISFCAHRLMMPLDELAANMKIVGEGNFNTKINISGSSEITNLGNSFNYMSEHIQKLITENYLVKLNEQTAKLIALEAQINPHFLYNTLQAISTEALINDQNQIHEMVISLASILRYSIKGGDMVTLADECAHVDKYIYLQKIRMGSNLDYNIEIAEDAYTCMIPKIALQTLVENSIVHGMNGEVTSISIRIKAYVENNRLYIETSDNGCGMDEKTLEYLNNRFALNIFTPTRTKGVGLVNINERLKILYKNDGIMNIDSSPQKGTFVKISIPVTKGFVNESINN